MAPTSLVSIGHLCVCASICVHFGVVIVVEAVVFIVGGVVAVVASWGEVACQWGSLVVVRLEGMVDVALGGTHSSSDMAWSLCS